MIGESDTLLVIVIIGMIIIFLGVHGDDRILGYECLQIVDVSKGLLKL